MGVMEELNTFIKGKKTHSNAMVFIADTGIVEYRMENDICHGVVVGYLGNPKYRMFVFARQDLGEEFNWYYEELFKMPFMSELFINGSPEAWLKTGLELNQSCKRGPLLAALQLLRLPTEGSGSLNWNITEQAKEVFDAGYSFEQVLVAIGCSCIYGGNNPYKWSTFRHGHWPIWTKYIGNFDKQCLTTNPDCIGSEEFFKIKGDTPTKDMLQKAGLTSSGFEAPVFSSLLELTKAVDKMFNEKEEK